ncbi:MAG: PIN domain-containing protein [Defluviitaleaceae bacterium]|nr:PIN domain-containing protein [Defluviitaleaceae bacterium]
MIYVLDTNIVIRYLRNDSNVRTNLRKVITQNHDIIIPQVVDYEISRGFRIASAPRKEANYQILLQECEVAKMNVHAWKYAALVYETLYRKGFTVGEIDILIGAFCILNGYTLVTNNTDDFINMDGISLVDWSLS